MLCVVCCALCVVRCVLCVVCCALCVVRCVLCVVCCALQGCVRLRFFGHVLCVMCCAFPLCAAFCVPSVCCVVLFHTMPTPVDKAYISGIAIYDFILGLPYILKNMSPIVLEHVAGAF